MQIAPKLSLGVWFESLQNDDDVRCVCFNKAVNYEVTKVEMTLVSMVTD